MHFHLYVQTLIRSNMAYSFLLSQKTLVGLIKTLGYVTAHAFQFGHSISVF